MMSNIIETTPTQAKILKVLKAYIFPGNIFEFKAPILDSKKLEAIPHKKATIKQNGRKPVK